MRNRTRNHNIRFLFTLTALAAALMMSSGCGWPFGGPSAPNAGGRWEAATAGATHVYRMILEQDGDRIAGTACGLDVTVPAETVTEFLDVAVTGDYPNVGFTAPSGARFTGRHDEDADEITGALVPGSPLQFERIQDGRCVLTLR